MPVKNILSVTDLCSYKFCPRTLYIKLVLGLREPAKPVMVLGSIRHKIYEDGNEIEEQLVSEIDDKLTRVDILKMFTNAYMTILNKSISSYSSQLQMLNMTNDAVLEQLKTGVIFQAESRADEIISFSSKFRVYGTELWEKLSPKIITEMKVSSKKLKLRGIVDRIEIYGNEYVPAEIKTGRCPTQGVWPDHRLQLSAYALLLNDKFNTKIKECLVKYVATNQTRQIVVNPFMEYEVISVRDEVFSLIEQKEPPKVCGKSYCTVCGYGNDFKRHLSSTKR